MNYGHPTAFLDWYGASAHPAIFNKRLSVHEHWLGTLRQLDHLRLLGNKTLCLHTYIPIAQACMLTLKILCKYKLQEFTLGGGRNEHYQFSHIKLCLPLGFVITVKNKPCVKLNCI